MAISIGKMMMNEPDLRIIRIYTPIDTLFSGKTIFFQADVKFTRFWKEGLKKLKRRLNQLKRGLTQQKGGSKWI